MSKTIREQLGALMREAHKEQRHLKAFKLADGCVNRDEAQAAASAGYWAFDRIAKQLDAIYGDMPDVKPKRFERCFVNGHPIDNGDGEKRPVFVVKHVAHTIWMASVMREGQNAPDTMNSDSRHAVLNGLIACLVDDSRVRPEDLLGCAVVVEGSEWRIVAWWNGEAVIGKCSNGQRLPEEANQPRPHPGARPSEESGVCRLFGEVCTELQARGYQKLEADRDFLLKANREAAEELHRVHVELAAKKDGENDLQEQVADLTEWNHEMADRLASRRPFWRTLLSTTALILIGAAAVLLTQRYGADVAGWAQEAWEHARNPFED